MCFVLYAGTTKEIPRKPWRKEAPDLCVEPLRDRDAPIKTHFNRPEVQYIGSTSGCGCDFPHVTLSSEDWVDSVLVREMKHEDQLDTETSNRLELVKLLRATGEPVIELYGIWDGDFSEPPRSREMVTFDQILDSNFCFKERGFYTIEAGR